MTRQARQFAEDLLKVWSKAHDLPSVQKDPSWTAFSGSAKDILLGLGMEWDNEEEEYTFPWLKRQGLRLAITKRGSR